MEEYIYSGCHVVTRVCDNDFSYEHRVNTTYVYNFCREEVVLVAPNGNHVDAMPDTKATLDNFLSRHIDVTAIVEAMIEKSGGCMVILEFPNEPDVRSMCEEEEATHTKLIIDPKATIRGPFKSRTGAIVNNRLCNYHIVARDKIARTVSGTFLPSCGYTIGFSRHTMQNKLLKVFNGDADYKANVAELKITLMCDSASYRMLFASFNGYVIECMPSMGDDVVNDSVFLTRIGEDGRVSTICHGTIKEALDKGILIAGTDIRFRLFKTREEATNYHNTELSRAKVECEKATEKELKAANTLVEKTKEDLRKLQETYLEYRSKNNLWSRITSWLTATASLLSAAFSIYRVVKA